MCAEESPSRREAAFDPRTDPELSLDALQRIDRQCAQFEEALRAGESPAITSYLSEASAAGAEYIALLRELLALELEYRWRRGQRPALDEYRQRFPAHEELLSLVFRESTRGLPETAPAFLVDHPRYRVLRLLGSGGMGAVYYAEHRALERGVALKVIRGELLADAEAVERFRAEAKAAATLNHPNVVAVHDAETAGNEHFLVMEYVAGADLAQTVIERGPLPVALACDYIRQAALGLQHAHEPGMVHRDITPRNLMLTERGQVKILDFGLAYFAGKTNAADPASPPAGTLGCVDYMAPEQAADPQSADIRADIYSLGCTLHFLLTRQPPLPTAKSPEPTPPCVASARPDVPAELSLLLSRMLSHSPADRPQTPQEVATALAPFCGDSPDSRATTRGAGPKMGLAPSDDRTRQRRRWLATAVLSLCAVAAAWFGLAWLRGPHGDETLQQPTEAHRLYREGLLLLGQRQEPQTRQAIKRLERACKLDPDFALAHTALADAYNLCADYGWEMPEDVLPKARQAARRALQLDDDLAEAHLALALAVESYDCDWRQAEAEYLRALELKPQLPAAHHWYAWFLAQQGRWDEAARQIEQARQLGPDEVIIANNVGKLDYLRRDYTSAIEHHKYALELSPDFRKAHRDLGLAYAELGRLDDALGELDQAEGLTDDGRDVSSARAYALARNDRGDDARQLLAQLEPLADRKPLAYEIAAVHAALGDKDQAFRWLQQAFRQRSAGRTMLAVDPRLDALRADARFAALLKAAGLPAPR